MDWYDREEGAVGALLLTEAAKRRRGYFVEPGPIGRFVHKIPLRRNNVGTFIFSPNLGHFLAVLRCNGRAILRSSAPECQS